MNVGVNYLREHIIEKARIHYVIEAGGGQPNVVPDYARSWYYARAPEMDQLEHIYRRVEKIAEGAALMTETTLKIEMDRGSYNKIPSRTLSEVVTAMFEGTVHLAEGTEEKRRIMNYMFARQERPSPTGEADPHKTRIGKDAEIGRTTIGWISVEELTGKKSAEVKF